MILRLTPRAEADISAIAHYIAEDNPLAAERWLGNIHRHCSHLAETPAMGVARSDVRPGLRTFPVGNYLILYRQITGGAEIVRVVHGARQWQELL